LLALLNRPRYPYSGGAATLQQAIWCGRVGAQPQPAPSPERRSLRSQKLPERWRIVRIGGLGTKRLLVACWRRRRLDEGLVRLAAFRLGPTGLQIGRRHRAWCPVRVAFAIRIHDAEIVLRVLIEVFGRYPVAAGRCFARQSNIAFEDLIRVATNLYVWAIAVKSLTPLGHPRTVVVRITPVAAAARSLVWSWSHDTRLIAVNTVGPMSGGSIPWPLSGGCGPVCAAFPDDGEPPSSATLDGKTAHSNKFLLCPRRRSGYDAARDAGEIALASLDRQAARL